MLKIKFIEKFKNDQPFLVIVSDKEGFNQASQFFGGKQGAYLNDKSITDFYRISPLDTTHMYLNPDECKEIARHCRNLAESEIPQHAYMDSIALGDDIEIIISYQEYDDLFE